MKRYSLRLAGLIGLLFAFEGAQAQFYMGSFNEFGKNRVQYRSFLWQQYRFEAFDTYYYEGGQQLAQFTCKVAERNIRQIEDIFDYSLSDKIQFIVYNSQSDFKQSNIGLNMDEMQNIGGVSNIVGNKVFLFFEGDHRQFERQIREGLSQVLVRQILFGGGWRDVIKTNTYSALPDWYTEGLVLYASKNVDHHTQSVIRSGIQSGRWNKFNRLEGREAHIAGYALWDYVASVYGENVLPNILYMSRVSQNVESGFLFVLGKSLDTVLAEFMHYHENRYATSDLAKTTFDLESHPIKVHKEQRVTRMELSPDGRYITYVTNVLGQYRLYLYDTQSQKRKKIFKAEHKLQRIPDYSFPVMAWHPSGKAFSFITEWRGKLMLNTYSVDDKDLQKREILRLDKVLSMSYSPNGQQLVFSGVDNGQTDLYLYYFIGNRQERLTNDLYADFDPSFSLDGQRILFSSNRPDDTLRTKVEVREFRDARDIFAYDLKSRSPYLERITNTPSINEREPHQFGKQEYTFIADYEGTVNRYIATYDSTISRIDTIVHYRYFSTVEALSNFRYDILEYSVQPQSQSYAILAFHDKKYRFYTGSFADDLSLTSRREPSEGDEESPKEKEMPYIQEGVEMVRAIEVPPRERSSKEVDVRNYTFEGERSFEYEQETVTITELPSSRKERSRRRATTTVLDTLSLPGARNYNINFAIEQVTAQLDNQFLTNFYQPLSGPGNLNPGVGPVLGVSISDLFEDYRLTGAVRLSGNLDNNTYLVSYDDLSKRVDKRLMFIRESNRFQFGQSVARVITYQGSYRLSYPVNEVLSFRGTGILRHEQGVNLAVEVQSLQEPNRYFNYAGLKGEVVFDNVLDMGLNLRRGIRAKAWAEYYRDPLDGETDFIVFGADLRQYQRIHRNLIWANRMAWSTSLGRERLAYFLGGVDQWLIPRSDNSLPLDPEQNFQYQTIGTPMRGFIYNVRNGNSFAVINSELRWPVFSYLFDRPLRSDFLNNFQLLAFGDVGSAWTGPSPFSPENAFNTTVIRTGDLTIELENNRNPIIFGYGFGVRSRLFGYFVRADWAWGVDDGITLPSVFYISLALDF